jgi:chromosome segregation ATPase
MKLKVIALAAIVACLGLLIGLFIIKQRGDDRHTADASSIADYSNQVVSASLKITELNQVNLTYSNSLTVTEQQAAQLSNDLVAASASLAESKASLAGAQTQITGLNTRITDLETQNQTLDERATELTNTIARLDALIAETQTRLARSEGDNSFLQSELQKQMAARAEMEHKFNDLDTLRTQVKKVKNDLFVARHAQLMKNDTTGMKGAQLINSRTLPVPGSTPDAPASALNVEIGSDGSVRVIPPMGASEPPAE